MQVDVALEVAGEEGLFDLLLKKRSGVAVAPFSILQLPISFAPRTLEESAGELSVSAELPSIATEPLLWRYPLKVIPPPNRDTYSMCRVCKDKK